MSTGITFRLSLTLITLCLKLLMFKYARNKYFGCLFLIVSNPSVCSISMSSLDDEVDEKKESLNIGNWQLKQYQFSSVCEILWYSVVVIWMAAGTHFRCVHKSQSSHCNPSWFLFTGFSTNVTWIFPICSTWTGIGVYVPCQEEKSNPWIANGSGPFPLSHHHHSGTSIGP